MSKQVQKVLTSSEKHEGDVTCCVYSNNLLYSSGADGKIKIWDNELNLKRTIDAHDAYIYCVAIDSSGRIYSSSSDEKVKYIDNPIDDNSKCVELFHSYNDEIQVLTISDDVLYTGDDKGVVTMWVDGKIKFKFNLVEEVRSMAVENDTLYTIRSLDLVITTIVDGKSGRYMTRSTIAGKSPLYLFGPLIENKKKYVLFLTRDGKGITMIKNNASEKFPTVWTKENVHEMIINSICGTEDIFYTGGWDGIVKKWIKIDNDPELSVEIKVNSCINTMCNGNRNCIFVGCSDGMLRKIIT